MSQSNASERIARAVQQRLLRAFHADLPTPPQRILVGFSGGADSLALALVLARIAPAIPSTIELIHIDHRLRPDSGEDAEAARALAASIGLPLLLKTASGDVRALHPGVGLEEAARRERYRLLAAETGPSDTVALAHHAQDQAETVLLHLMRGAGLRGATGMSRLQALSIPWWDGAAARHDVQIWRPLLAERRDDIRAIPRAANLLPVEDPSNEDLVFRRNALRQHVIPMLESIDPGAIDGLARFASIGQVEDRYLDGLSHQQLARIDDGRGGIDAAGLLALDPAISRRVVLQWLEQVIGKTPTLDRVDALLDLARDHDETRVLEITGDLVAGMFGETLRCGTRGELETSAWRDAGLGLPLSDSMESIRIDGFKIVVRNNMIDRLLTIPLGTAANAIAVRRLGNELIEGMKAEGSDWLRTEHISPWIRSRVQGITVGGRMWWIPRMSDDYAGEDRIRVIWVTEEQD